MKHVQQKFWNKNLTHYRILEGNSVVKDNLNLEETLNYCIENRMLTSLGFMIGEDSNTRIVCENLLKSKNLI